jgi:hypothetical protein
MAPIRVSRVLAGGLAAGVVMIVIDAGANAGIYGAAWANAYRALGLPGENPGIPVFWTAFDLVGGVVIAWLYAAMRPRFGTGAKTAIYAGLVEWLLVHLTLYSHLVDHVFPASILLGTSACELVSAILGSLVARAIYKEESSASEAARPELA